MIDREKILPPQVDLSPRAERQIQLILQHDETVEKQCVRIYVAGKGCNGLQYAVGIGQEMPEDFVIQAGEIAVHMDPFCAFYLPEAYVDYVILASGQDGLVVEGTGQEQYKGKFWKDRPNLIPPQRETVSIE